MEKPTTYRLAEERPITPDIEIDTPNSHAGTLETSVRKYSIGRLLVFYALVAICLAHAWATWAGIGGREGLTNGWPLLLNDQTLYYHSATVTRSFLKSTGTTAGYDPAFMAGYAKSLIFPSSSTLPEVVVYLLGGERPEFAFKLYVLICICGFPWIIWLISWGFGANLNGRLAAVALAVVYFWTDFPANYAHLGMVPYLTAIPLGLLATRTIAGFVERGGMFRWLMALVLSSFCVLIHFTSAMVVIPAAVAAYIAGALRSKKRNEVFPATRHVGLWLIPVAVLGLNAFWWWPGVLLAGTKGESGFAFAHPESLLMRLLDLTLVSPEIESWLVGGGILGLVIICRRNSVAGVALLGFTGAGFFWGYLAGAFRVFDFLQPGRHTFAFFLGLVVACGIAWDEVVRRLRVARGFLPFWAALCIVLVSGRMFAQRLDIMTQRFLAHKATVLHTLMPGTDWQSPHAQSEFPFLSSKPSPLLLWTIDRIKRYVQPGERLLYEEAGFGIPGENDPFQSLRFSAILPERCDVEVIGGPYLHASLNTNFTQFGEGKLFENPNWDREFFVAHAKLYRPTAIVCWTRKAKAFCEANSDLIEVKEVDPTKSLMIARVKGFEGAAIRGGAKVKAEPNRLTITDIKPDVDGLTVLRYHSAPCLRSRPEGLWQPVLLEGDPVPFIGVKASAEPIVIELVIPPPWARLPK